MEQSSLILGYPGSGRYTNIVLSISKKENIEINKLKYSPDFLHLTTSDALEIENKLSVFAFSQPIHLNKKYCIVENIDFESETVQELYLKYIEDSNILFYFTAYSLEKIVSKALLSRLTISQIDSLFSFENLSESLKATYKDYYKNVPIYSLSQLEIWYQVKSDFFNLINFNEDYNKYKYQIIGALYKLDKFPVWYKIDVCAHFMIYLMHTKYSTNTVYNSIFSRLIAKYNKMNYTEYRNLELFIDSCLVIHQSCLGLEVSYT